MSKISPPSEVSVVNFLKLHVSILGELRQILNNVMKYEMYAQFHFRGADTQKEGPETRCSWCLSLGQAI